MRPSIVLAFWASACVTPFGDVVGNCTTDSDRDGVCDLDDICPNDATNDRDGDGVCGAEDACPGEDDRIDADEDGVPDGCDPCLGDPGNDADNDGVCAATDVCPEDPEDKCDVPVTIAVQVDLFPANTSWRLVDYRSSLIDNGTFSSVGDGYFARVDVPAASTSCLTVSDVDGDGGVRGMVFSRSLSRLYAEWEWGSYGSRDTFCFNPSEGDRFTPPKEADWVASGICEVDLDLFTGAYASEVGWMVTTEADVEIAGAPSGSYAQDGATVSTSIRLTDGTYRFYMLDAYGDGWVGGDDNASFSLSVNGDPAFLTGALQGGNSAWLGFTLDCP